MLLKPWTLFSSLFAHFGLLHLFSNLLFLFFAGNTYERFYGPKRLLHLYLIGGPIVMRGYWQYDAANQEVFQAPWFKSGYLGQLDEQGFLYITGRKKELIVTAGGKNVAPAVLEDRLRAHPLVSQCMVVGDNQPFIAALVTIDQEALKGWVANNKKEGASINDLVNDPDLIAVIQTAVDDANKAVSKAESIRKFTLLPTDFTIAGGHLTAKLSVKRHVVAKEFAKEIEALFTK